MYFAVAKGETCIMAKPPMVGFSRIQMIYSSNVAPRIRLHANLLDHLLDMCDIS